MTTLPWNVRLLDLGTASAAEARTVTIDDDRTVAMDSAAVVSRDATR